MSAKPYHAGHDGLVSLASKENDEVHLYVSLSDRDEVSGDAMKKIWQEHIQPSLPANVNVVYGNSPVRLSYEDIGNADKNSSNDTFLIYSDPTDAATNFSDNSLQKYAPNLFKSGRVKTRPVKRTSTINISGTKMRGFIANNDKVSFLKYMPKKIDGNAIWNILLSMKPEKKKAKRKNEALLRSFIRNVLR